MLGFLDVCSEAIHQGTAKTFLLELGVRGTTPTYPLSHTRERSFEELVMLTDFFVAVNNPSLFCV